MISHLPPLPDHRYIPGQTPRHPDDAFDPIRNCALTETQTETAPQNPAWLYGLKLFDAGFWWEAHEVWEVVWMNARPNSAERAMTQAVIQLANAALKREMGAENACRRLRQIADDLAREATRYADAPMAISQSDFDQAFTAIMDGETPNLSRCAAR